MKKTIIFLTVLVFFYCGGGERSTSPKAEQHERQGQLEKEMHEHEALEQKASEHEQEGHQELHLSPEKQKAWGIALVSPAREKIAAQMTLPGVMSLNQNRTALISSFVPGKVISLSADLGDKVRKGQVLLTINSPEFAQAKANFLQARAKFKLSRKEYERAKMLLKEKAMEEREYLRREAEYEKLSTEYGVYGSLLHSYGIPHEQIDEFLKECDQAAEEGKLCEMANPNQSITSPIQGTIIFRDVVIGEHVEPSKILFTVSDLNTLWAILDAYEKDFPFISPDCRVTIASSLYPDVHFEAQIAYISDLIDQKLRTVKIRVKVLNREGLLRPNMYIQGFIESAATQEVLSVPEEAIQNMNGKKIVFVLEKENVFAAKPVKLGAKLGDRRIITEGLEEKERVVIKGAFNLKTELSKTAFGQVHVH